MTEKNADWRLASTVVVARPGTHGAAEIYMVRRSARSPFMPSTLVFPGGRLDPEDGAPEDSTTWERAARRECAEEAGLRLSGELWWFDTWLTPSAESRRRYHTRFFLALLEEGEGQHAEADGHETHEGRWASVANHLAAWDRMDVDLPPPTLCTLLRLSPLGWAGLSTVAEIDASGTILPKVTLEKSGPVIIMPHDPAYGETPGEALPAPARVEDLPRRFVRDERVWRPWSG